MAVRTRTQKKRGGAASARKKGSAAAAKKKPRVAILMGSASDGPSMQAAADVLEELNQILPPSFSHLSTFEWLRGLSAWHGEALEKIQAAILPVKNK